jgi:aspartate racemase
MPVDSGEWCCMLKHVGIIAVSFEGAALCYRTVCQQAMAVLGGLAHPEVSVHNYSLSRYMSCIERRDWIGVACLMASSAEKLAAAGADFAVCPDNTVHVAFEEAEKRSPIPLLSIIDIVAEECRVKGYAKVGVLGTKYTMQGQVYTDALSRRGIEVVVPDVKDQERVNSVIFNELVPFGTTKSAVSDLTRIIQRLKDSGCQAVILGCTEIPLVINEENSPLPLVDSTHLLALKALERSLGKSLT